MTNHIKKNLILLLTLAGLSAYAQIPVNPPGGGGTGVTSINSTTGAFTFTGSGVSCTGSACEFSGTGSGIGSIEWTVPSWLTASPSTISASGTQAFTATTGQTSHQVIGTCGTATSFTPCALVAGDIPTLPYLSSSTQLPTSITAVAHNFLTSYISSTGVFTLAQPGFTDLSGNIGLAQGPTSITGILKDTAGTFSLAVSGTDYLTPSGSSAALSVGSSSAFGVVKCDGTTITCASGVITATASGTGTVTHTTGALTSDQMVIGNGTADVKVDTGCSTNGTGVLTCAAYSTSGTTQGLDAFAVGTGTITAALPTNYVGIIGPPSGTPTYFLQLPSANPTAGQTMVFAAPTSVNGVSQAVGTWATPGTGTTVTVASGTATLGTTAIASGACATVVTVTATGAASTDSIIWNPNASIKAVTGYAPSTSGGLNVAAYPTSGNVSFDVCNSSASSITPGAVTLNWRIVR